MTSILPSALMPSIGPGRLVRFALTGAVAGGLQLMMFAALMDTGTPHLPANVLAFLLASQVNFLLSERCTWGDRALGDARRSAWTRFMCSIAATAALNLGIFALLHPVIPPLAAAAAGIGLAATFNFILGDLVVFRAVTNATESPTEAGGS